MVVGGGAGPPLISVDAAQGRFPRNTGTEVGATSDGTVERAGEPGWIRAETKQCLLRWSSDAREFDLRASRAGAHTCPARRRGFGAIYRGVSVESVTNGRVLPSVLLGIGLGGFIDGIVLHQILQWHHMVSDQGCCPMNSLVGLEDNTVADGIFHAATWTITLIGTVAAVKTWRSGELAPPWMRHVGGLLAGWGVFNFIDSGNHFVLGLHHIRDDLGGPVGWDIGFLVFALLLIAVGWRMIRASARTADRLAVKRPSASG